MAGDVTIDHENSSNEEGDYNVEDKGHNGDAKEARKAKQAERKRRRKRDETWRLIVAYKA